MTSTRMLAGIATACLISSLAIAATPPLDNATFAFDGKRSIIIKGSCNGHTSTVTNDVKQLTGTIVFSAKNALGEYPFNWTDSFQHYLATGTAERIGRGNSYDLTWDESFKNSGSLKYLAFYGLTDISGVKYSFSLTRSGSKVTIKDRAYIKVKQSNGCSYTHEATISVTGKTAQ